MSGQRINLDKSIIRFSPCVNPTVRATIKDILGLRSAGRVDMYLGIPSMVGRSKTEILRYIVDRVWSKVNSWKEKLLSKAGKEIMIKSVLQSIPVYVMGILRLPKTTCDEITRILRKFWWGNDVNKGSIYWKAWHDLCKQKAFGGLGFRDLHDFNTALLAKQGWRIIQNPEALVSKVLKSKYYPYSKFNEAMLGRNPSFVWRSILSARPLLLDGGKWRIGDGLSIKMWGDRWLYTSPMGGLIGPPTKELQHSTVSDFVDGNDKTWNIPKLREVLNPVEVELVKRIRIPILLSDDKFCWPVDQVGEYTVKSGYRQLRDRLILDDARKALWLKIWKCKVPPKIRVFAWRLLNGILPLKTSLFFRGIIPTDNCPMCGTTAETLDHCFVRCHWAMAVWRDSILASNPTLLHGDDILISWLADVSGNASMEELGKVLVLLWYMWTCRNKCVFEEVVSLPCRVAVKAMHIYNQYPQAAEVTSIPMQRGSRTQKWTPPEEGIIKLNCDGALKPDGRAGIGVICRAHDGAVMATLCSPVDYCHTPMEVEAIAIRDGLSFARDCGFRCILVESDANRVIKELVSRQPGCALHGGIFQEIWALQNSFELCDFHFVPRTCNSVADRLASIGVYESHPRYWIEETPACIADVLFSDI